MALEEMLLLGMFFRSNLTSVTLDDNFYLVLSPPDPNSQDNPAALFSPQTTGQCLYAYM